MSNDELNETHKRLIEEAYASHPQATISYNVPAFESDIAGIRDGASEIYDPHSHTSESTRAYWDLRLIARIDQLTKERDNAREAVNLVERLVEYYPKEIADKVAGLIK